MDESQSLNGPHELMKAFLFLRTAFTAVTNMWKIVKSTKACILYASVNGDYAYHCELEESLENETADVERWKMRLVEAQIGFIDWYARVELRKPLPPEIVQMIGHTLGDGVSEFQLEQLTAPKRESHPLVYEAEEVRTPTKHARPRREVVTGLQSLCKSISRTTHRQDP